MGNSRDNQNSVPSPHRPEQHENVERFYTSIKSLNELDRQEIHNVIRGQLNPSLRETCFAGVYYRATAAAETILALNHVKHLQGIASAARSLFELAVEMRLLDLLPQGPEKMTAAIDIEKLRAAKKVVAFKSVNPSAPIDDSVFRQFITIEEALINAKQSTLWPGRRRVDYWSLKNMAERSRFVGAPFEELYEAEYPRLSWYVHSGLIGFANLSKDSFELMAGIAFTIAVKSYAEILRVVTREFRINLADKDIEKKIDYAMVLPFTEGPEQIEQLRRELFG
jgi:hypothetical protein